MANIDGFRAQIKIIRDYLSLAYFFAQLIHSYISLNFWSGAHK